MSEFQLINEKRFPLKVRDSSDNVDLLPYYRWEHRVTLGYRGRRFMVFLDNLNSAAFVEEITSGSLEKIADDKMWGAVFKEATSRGYLNIFPPLSKPVGYNKSKINTLSKEIKI